MIANIFFIMYITHFTFYSIIICLPLGRKPLLNQVNYALLHLHLAGNHNAKPSHEELREWLHSGQVDVIRMNK